MLIFDESTFQTPIMRSALVMFTYSHELSFSVAEES